jgi:NAD(P)-dependent dehydrogenase (short-subunit alcohol dehydrogenase family)
VGKEVAPFRIRICALEPGGMRTEWGHAARATLQHLPQDYEASLGDAVLETGHPRCRLRCGIARVAIGVTLCE